MSRGNGQAVETALVAAEVLRLPVSRSNGSYVANRDSLIPEATVIADQKVPSTETVRAKYEWDRVFLAAMDQLYDERFRRRHRWASNG